MIASEPARERALCGYVLMCVCVTLDLSVGLFFM